MDSAVSINPDIKSVSVDFIKWRFSYAGQYGHKLKVHPQIPELEKFLVLGEDEKNVLGAGAYLTADELFDYYLKHKDDRHIFKT